MTEIPKIIMCNRKYIMPPKLWNITLCFGKDWEEKNGLTYKFLIGCNSRKIFPNVLLEIIYLLNTEIGISSRRYTCMSIVVLCSLWYFHTFEFFSAYFNFLLSKHAYSKLFKILSIHERLKYSYTMVMTNHRITAIDHLLSSAWVWHNLDSWKILCV